MAGGDGVLQYTVEDFHHNVTALGTIIEDFLSVNNGQLKKIVAGGQNKW